MRSLIVALCVCSLAIAARAQCTASESRPCTGNGKCDSSNKCVCNTVVDTVGVTTTFTGSQCEKFSSWWYTNETAPVTCTYDLTCGGHGDLVDGKCKCKTYYDGNTTKQYSGQCCNTWFSYWQASYNSAWSFGGNASSGAAGCTSSGCSGHGQCVKGACECQKLVEGNRVTEYYGPSCNNWHMSWNWSSSSSSSSSWSHSDSLGTGTVWAADGIGMRESRQEWYCYCDNITQTYFDGNSKQGSICAAYCNNTFTCNTHGKCSTTGTEQCTCDTHFAGRWCDQCVTGWGNKNSSDPKQLCNVCAPGWYPLSGSTACTKQCWDDTTCSGHGTCNSNGMCDCKPGYTGASCSTCKVDVGYDDDKDPKGYTTCRVCDAAVHCSNAGICSSKGTCLCANGYTGSNCGNCSTSGKFPNCAGAVKRAGAAAATDCPGPNLALPIILSIIGTLLVMLIAFAIYRMWAAKQAGAGGAGTAKSSNWSEFEKDSSTAYSQL